MKLAATILLIAITLLLSMTACFKKLTVEDYPALLLNVNLTPGEKDKEVAVFLYTTKDDIIYEIKTKKDENQKENKYLTLILNNTFKASKVDKLSTEGIEELIENARAVQFTQGKNKNNSVITRLIFKLKDPQTTITPIIKVKRINVEQVKKAADQSNAAQAIAQSMGKPESIDGYIIVIAFWVMVIGILLISYFVQKFQTNKIKATREVEEESEESENQDGF